MCYILSRSIIPLIDATVGGGSDLPATAGTLQQDYGIIEGGNSYNIPSGAYKVTVWNTGLGDITVGGETIPEGQVYVQEHALNKTNNTQDFTTSLLVVVPDDGQATYLRQYPSA